MANIKKTDPDLNKIVLVAHYGYKETTKLVQMFPEIGQLSPLSTAFINAYDQCISRGNQKKIYTRLRDSVSVNTSSIESKITKSDVAISGDSHTPLGKEDDFKAFGEAFGSKIAQWQP